MKLVLGVIFCAALAWTQHEPHYVKGRNTVVHLFEWKWSDIAVECENFLSKKGYAGIQISPPSENAVVYNRPWWEKYQPISYILSNRGGNESALADMIRRCNNVGVRIYVDIVLNHMASSTGQGTAGSKADPNSKYYPAVPYHKEHFHHPCDIDYNNSTSVRQCELVGLKDLDQSHKHVRTKIVDFMNHLVRLGVAGFRVDAAKHMWPADLEAIYGRVNNLSTEFFPPGSRAVYYQEVINTGGGAVQSTEYTSFGRVTEFRYGMELARCFRGSNPLKYLNSWGRGWGLLNGDDVMAFIDNHDTERDDEAFLNYKEAKVYKAAIAFMLAHPYGSMTKIMSSYHFSGKDDPPPQHGDHIVSPGFHSDGTCTNGWVCQHRWSPVFHMVEFRNVVAGTNLHKWWSGGDNQIAFSRGNKGFYAVTIRGDINASIPTGLPDGSYCDVISGSLVNGSCTGRTVNVGGGFAHVYIVSWDYEAALAIHVNAKL